MFDLHIHTNHSDGVFSPAAIVAMAKTQGIETLAITDHDGTDGVAEAMTAGAALGIRVIPGIEISVINAGGNMHILGYNIDLANPAFKSAVETMRQRRADRNQRMLVAFKTLGIAMTEEEVRLFCYTDYMGKPQMAQVLKAKGLVADVREAFKSEQFFRSDVLRQIRREKVSPAEGIGIIRVAGGVAVLAHPKTLRLGLSDLDLKLKELVGYGLGGLECYHSEHSPEEIQNYLGLAKKYGLIVTLGSDFHGGDIKPDVKLGLGLNENLKPYTIDLPF
jgi:hypothetical protein